MKQRILVIEKPNGDYILGLELKDGGILDVNELASNGRYDVTYQFQENEIIMDDISDF